MPAGRPRTAIPEKEEVIELGKNLVSWASEQTKKGAPIRVRFCDWYTDQGFIRKQWEHMREKPEFQWYYEKARALMASRYIDGTVNPSIAHRYLRIYDPELRDEENIDLDADAERKAKVAKAESEVDKIDQDKLESLMKLIETARDNHKPSSLKDKEASNK